MSIGASRTIVSLKDFRAPNVAERISNAVESLANQFAGGMQSWTSTAKKVGATTDGLVRASPWRAVGAVAIAGLAAGLLVSRAAQRGRRQAAKAASASNTGVANSEVLGG